MYLGLVIKFAHLRTLARAHKSGITGVDRDDTIDIALMRGWIAPYPTG